MKYKNIMSLGAHSLDAELLGGPLMIKYAKQGAKCTLVHVTQGRLENPNATEKEKQDYLQQIQVENKNAAEKMGCHYLALGYPSTKLPTFDNFVNEIMDLLMKEKIDLVITHARGTLHQRHYYTYETVTEAVRRLRKKGIQVNLLYGECSEDLAGFNPTLYISMNLEIVKIWFDSLKQYSIFNGAVNDMPYLDYYTSMGKVRAIEAGLSGQEFVKAYMHGALVDNE